jgi:ribosomal protein S18 acetylase RimI-like enzyme
MGVAIRRATVDDLPAVSALLGATWHATYDGVYGVERVAGITGRWHSVDTLARGLDRPDGCFLVAEASGRMLGTISIGRGCDGELKLDRLYVMPNAQGQGLGRRLLEAALATCPAARAISLEVEPANAQAVRFYERQDFVVTGRTGDCGGSGDSIPALVMTRRLMAQPPRS